MEELSETLLQLQEEDITRAERVEIHCGPLPLLWQADPVRVHIPELDLLDRRGVVREWNFPFDYAVGGGLLHRRLGSGWLSGHGGRQVSALSFYSGGGGAACGDVSYRVGGGRLGYADGYYDHGRF